MFRIATSLMALMATTFLMGAPASADQYVYWGCTYKEGKGPADLQNWFEKIAKPAFDASGFAAKVTVITPTINNSDDPSDFYWVEHWPSLASFAKGASPFLETGGAHANVVTEAFELWDCRNSMWQGSVIYPGK